jgi:hypothetical protein
MNGLILSLISIISMGLGAMLTFDLWGLFLKHTFKIPRSNICLVGRWIRYMPQGTLTHSNIVCSPQKSGECVVGWIAHYLIGATFAFIFIELAGNNWLRHPTLIPPIAFGIVTVLAPFLIMQPSFGFGLAGSKTSNPAQARLRTLMNHVAFGIGLYLFGWLVCWLLQVLVHM